VIDFDQIRAELAAIVDKFHVAAHDLIAKIEGQATDDVHTIGQQISDDVHTVETDAQQATQPGPAATDQLAAPGQ
jgi:predicted phage gp36 major capsid-like protein